MQRKDGLTFVFKMFLGDIVYKKEREANDIVTVKGIQYDINDDDFLPTQKKIIIKSSAKRALCRQNASCVGKQFRF